MFQGGCGASILRDVQNLTGQSPKQPALGDPSLSRWVGPDSLQRCLPTSTILWFCEKLSWCCEMILPFSSIINLSYFPIFYILTFLNMAFYSLASEFTFTICTLLKQALQRGSLSRKRCETSVWPMTGLQEGIWMYTICDDKPILVMHLTQKTQKQVFNISTPLNIY